MPGDIDSFLRRELGQKGMKILNEFCKEYAIEHITDASEDIKKEFVSTIVPEFRQKSLGRSKVLTSELLSIIGLKEDINLKVGKEKLEKHLVRSYVNVDANIKLKAIFSKIEAVFNLFWTNAAEAFQLGIEMDEIHRITRMVLEDVREDLMDICDEIEVLFGFRATKDPTLAKTSFTKKKRKLNLETSDYDETSESKSSPVQEAIDEFRQKINGHFDELENVFLETLDEEIVYERMKKDDRKLVGITKKKTREIWGEIMATYEKMKSKIESQEKLE